VTKIIIDLFPSECIRDAPSGYVLIKRRREGRVRCFRKNIFRYGKVGNPPSEEKLTKEDPGVPKIIKEDGKKKKEGTGERGGR